MSMDMMNCMTLIHPTTKYIVSLCMCVLEREWEREKEMGIDMVNCMTLIHPTTK